MEGAIPAVRLYLLLKKHFSNVIKGASFGRSFLPGKISFFAQKGYRFHQG
jgi:hypothetical protein